MRMWNFLNSAARTFLPLVLRKSSLPLLSFQDFHVPIETRKGYDTLTLRGDSLYKDLRDAFRHLTGASGLHRRKASARLLGNCPGTREYDTNRRVHLPHGKQGKRCILEDAPEQAPCTAGTCKSPPTHRRVLVGNVQPLRMHGVRKSGKGGDKRIRLQVPPAAQVPKGHVLRICPRLP